MRGKETKRILLKDLLKKSINYEKAEEFSQSIFYDVYDRAKESVRQIVSDNEEIHTIDYQKHKGVGIEVKNVVSFIGGRGTGKSSSMLSFLEALTSYRSDPPYFGFENTLFKNEADMMNIRFFALPCIDAAVLEESENFFGLVLANMLSQIEQYEEKETGQTDKFMYRTLVQKLEKIYTDFITIKESRQQGSGEYSAMEKLKNVASSQRIREELEDLVEEYLQYVKDRTDGVIKKAYLVVAIDDLDMAHYNKYQYKRSQINMKSYNIMRSISKYLSIPGVIVLAAYNQANLHRQCVDLFESSSSDRKRWLNEAMYSLKDNETLAAQFMEKVFAPMYRIYMPDWKQRDFERSRIQIDIGNETEIEDIFSRYRNNHKTLFSVKDFLLVVYAEIIGVYFDCEGGKRHFLEPDSLRDLNSRLQLLTDSLAYRKQRYVMDCDARVTEGIFQKIKDDVYFRFPQEKLYMQEEKELFFSLMQRSIDRRSRKIVSMIAPNIEPLGKFYRLEMEREGRKESFNKNNRGKYDPIIIDNGNGRVLQGNMDLIGMPADNQNTDESENQGNNRFVTYEVTNNYKVTNNYQVSNNNKNKNVNENRSNGNVEYSFAELIHCIYHITRQEKNFTKEFVACILNSYSIYLSQIYKTYRGEIEKIEYKVDEKYRYEEKKKENKEVNAKFEIFDNTYQLIKRMIGATICGKWTEYFFPQISCKGAELGISCFSREKRIEFELEFQIDNVKNFDMDVDVMLDACIFIMTLFSKIFQWKSLELTYIERKQNGEDKSQIGIKCDMDADTSFELTSFINYAILYPDYLHKMEQLLLEGFQKMEGKASGLDVFKNEVNRRIKAKFDALWRDYIKWDRDYGTMLVPICDFDLMYNFMKHLFRELRWEMDYTIEIVAGKGIFVQEFCKMNNKFQEHLGRIDKFYCLDNKEQNEKEERARSKSMAARFRECPFVKVLEKIKDENEWTEEEKERNRKLRDKIETCILYRIILPIHNVKKQNVGPDEDDIG